MERAIIAPPPIQLTGVWLTERFNLTSEAGNNFYGRNMQRRGMGDPPEGEGAGSQCAGSGEVEVSGEKTSAPALQVNSGILRPNQIRTMRSSGAHLVARPQPPA